MLEAALTALAAAGGTAVVQAAGTDAWGEFRSGVARLLGRGDQAREYTELERLDQTVTVLEEARLDEAVLVRARQESSWQTRFETLLEGLAGEERGVAVTQLRALVEEQSRGSGAVSAGDDGVAIGGSATLQADRGSVVAWNAGDVTVTPQTPGPHQG
ncbi:hypothetical protein ACIHEJ_34630 [Streptomyces sp. NPDC052301]|uniref:hypothetical protein n=1 Tax=Streptomyces sp. NPDC052301 TaxID=3365687 RepID=UPI0037D62E0A